MHPSSVGTALHLLFRQFANVWFPWLLGMKVKPTSQVSFVATMVIKIVMNCNIDMFKTLILNYIKASSYNVIKNHF